MSTLLQLRIFGAIRQKSYTNIEMATAPKQSSNTAEIQANSITLPLLCATTHSEVGEKKGGNKKGGFSFDSYKQEKSKKAKKRTRNEQAAAAASERQ
ncbi:hypothetical protein G7K_3454-t1 [Saitoella complicata NRRL Y-17804]|uniref:Uncharacterized protein n=1 Tax=Saitoella complicata (strain BCRC 22490 / CBS 7301 / JCM 7358 / NBRC 10748 / NRRL Y-17804) TaxID=698492 RepID=A0A0E9NHK4_SAICN|nr:hypothetical protein G7K_3454-t1 [Saitoella complicata NRRL Y-17804]